MKQQTQNNKFEWKEPQLREIINLRGGFAFKSEKFVDKGTAIIRISNFNNNDVDLSEAVYYPNKDIKEYKEFFLEENDILIAMSGATTGKIGIVKTKNLPCLLNQRVGKFKIINANLSWRYLLLFVKSQEFQKKVFSIAGGCAQPNISGKQIESVRIPLPFSNGKPDLKEQERIVNILEKAEKLKERGKNANDLLDEYLKSVFNEMFYNKGFETKRGNELFELSYGSGLIGDKRDNGKYPVYGSNGIVGNHSKFLVKGPGIIIGRKGSIGEVNYTEENFWPIDTTYYIKLREKIDMTFLFYLLKCYNLKLNRSTAIPGLNRNDVYNIKFINPPLLLQQKFAKIVEQVEKMKENIKKVKQNSEELFNSLMQKAFRGEL